MTPDKPTGQTLHEALIGLALAVKPRVLGGGLGPSFVEDRKATEERSIGHSRRMWSRFLSGGFHPRSGPTLTQAEVVWQLTVEYVVAHDTATLNAAMLDDALLLAKALARPEWPSPIVALTALGAAEILPFEIVPAEGGLRLRFTTPVRFTP